MRIKTVKLPGKNHTVPREIAPFITDLKQVVGVQRMGYGEFIYKGSCRSLGAEVRHYNETTRTLRVRVNSPEFQKIIFLTIDPKQRASIERFVENYEF